MQPLRKRVDMSGTFGPLLGSILLALTLSISACSKDPTAQDHIERAHTFLDQGEPSAAYIELKNALHLDPQKAEVHWLLGDLFLRSGNPADAENFLHQAIDRGWDPNATQPALARALFELQRHDEVLALKVDGLQDTAAADVLALQALAQIAQGNTKAAKATIVKAILKNPEATEPQLAHALILSSEEETEKARVVLEAALKKAPDSARGWHLLGLVKLHQGLHLEAREAFSAAMEHAPIWPEPITRRAMISLKLRDMAAAREDVATLAEIGANTPGSHYVQGLIHLDDRNYREVVGELSQATELAEEFPLIHYGLARAFLFTGEEEEALEAAQTYLEYYPNNVDARILMGVLRIRAQNYATARAMLQPVLDQNPSNRQALYLLAALEARDGNLDRSLALYTNLQQQQPQSPLSAVPEGSELVAAALRAGPLESNDTAVPDAASPPPEQAIIDIHNALAAEDYDTAIALASDLQWAETTKLGGHHVLARVYLLAGRNKDAIATINTALKRDEFDPISNLILADLALKKDDIKGANFRYKRILQQYPYHFATLMQMAAMDARTGNMSVFRARLDRAMHVDSAAIAPRLIKATHFLREGQPKEVALLLDPLLPLQQAAPSATGLTLLSMMAQGQAPLDQPTVVRMLNAGPGSEVFNYLLVNIARSRGQLDEVKNALQTIVHYSANHIPTVLGLAIIANLQGDRERFLAYTDILETLPPAARSSFVLGVLADASTVRGDLQTALTLAEKAFADAPSAGTLFLLTGHQVRLGKNATAIADMQNWLAEHPGDSGIRLSLGQLLESEGDLLAAEQQYRGVLEATPNNPIALNNLAWLLREKSPKEALLFARSALQAAPGQPQVMDTLAMIEHLGGESERALALLQRTLEIQPDYATAHYHQALVLAAMGKKKMALKSLQTLLQVETTEFPERAAAEALYSELRDQGTGTP